MEQIPSPKIQNFGHNVEFRPALFFTPRTEAEVLQCLEQYRGRNIRVIGRLHAWSEAAAGDDVVLDLRHLNTVRTEQRDGRTWAVIGAGCTVKDVIAQLEQQAGSTLPAIGLITGQSLVGAAATGTHGSGRNSISHYVDEVRLATYDDQGQPVIRTLTAGPELQAARCSLGCLGVILSVGIWCRPQYHVEEHFARHNTLDDVLEAEERYPLQAFFLIPWLWEYEAQHRRETDQPRSGLAGLYRFYFWLLLDLGLHVIVLVLSRAVTAAGVVKFFFRSIVPLTVIQNWRVVDRSQDHLTMYHQRFRHVEIETFATRSRLHESLAFVQELLRHAGGESNALSAATQERLAAAGLWNEVEALAGQYVHHYPICIRKVLPDETLISMAQGTEPWYAISFITYAKPRYQAGFNQFAGVLSRTMAALYNVRPHWGKICPLTTAEAERLYPRLAEFRDVVNRFDRPGVFRNRWVGNVLFGD